MANPITVQQLTDHYNQLQSTLDNGYKAVVRAKRSAAHQSANDALPFGQQQHPKSHLTAIGITHMSLCNSF